MNQREEAIKNLYKNILCRDADDSGLNHYYNSNFSIEQIQNLLINSEEYQKTGAFRINPGVLDKTKILNLERFYNITNLYYKHLLRFPIKYDYIKYYYSNLDIKEIEKDIVDSEEYKKYYNIRSEVKNLLKSKINGEITILSNSCIANFLHKIVLEVPSKTPTINNIIPTLDFIKYVNNLNYYINVKAEGSLLKSIEKKYAVVDLEDIELHFIHAPDKECFIQAERWNNRSKKIDMNKILVIFTDVPWFPSSSDNDVILIDKLIKQKKIIIASNNSINANYYLNIKEHYFGLENWINEFDKIKNINLNF